MPGRRKKGDGRDEQIEILRSIWNEMKELKAAFESQLEKTRQELGVRIDKTNDRLDALRLELKTEVDALRGRVVESEVRLATATTQLSTDVRDLSDLIREWRKEHREDRAEIKVRIARIEQHLGLTPPP